jgi:hypothetical protein
MTEAEASEALARLDSALGATFQAAGEVRTPATQAS